MNEVAEFEIVDKEGLDRAVEYLTHLYSIMLLKNADSEKSLKGGALCHFNIEIKVKEEWI